MVATSCADRQQVRAGLLFSPMISSCHSILGKLLPPTNAVAVYSLSRLSDASISGEPCSRAGVRVPSTSNMQMAFGCLRSANGLMPAGKTLAGVVVAILVMHWACVDG